MRALRMWIPGFLVLGLGLVLTGALTPQTFDGLPSTPATTLLLLPFVRMTSFIAGATTVGAILVGSLLGQDGRLQRIGRSSSLVFVVAAACELVLTLSDLLATDVWQALDPTSLRSFVTQIDDGRYALLRVLLGLVTSFILFSGTTPLSTVFGLLTLLTAAALPGFSGHSAAAISHWLASSTMAVHLAALHIWVGAVIALVASRASAHTVQRLSTIAPVAYIVTLLSGVANLLVRTVDWQVLLASQYGALLGLKTLVALAIGAFGYRQLRKGAEELRAGSATAYRQVLTVEVTLMLVIIAFAVTLARTPSP